MLVRHLLLAGSLDAQQRVQRGVRLARHRRGLGAAAADLLGVVDGEAGGAEGVADVEIHGDDPQRKPGLEVIVGMQRHDGGHRALVAFRPEVRGVGDGGGEHAAEFSEDLAAVGGEGVGVRGVGMHGSLVPVGNQKRWALVLLISTLYILSVAIIPSGGSSDASIGSAGCAAMTEASELGRLLRRHAAIDHQFRAGDPG